MDIVILVRNIEKEATVGKIVWEFEESRFRSLFGRLWRWETAAARKDYKDTKAELWDFGEILSRNFY